MSEVTLVKLSALDAIRAETAAASAAAVLPLKIDAQTARDEALAAAERAENAPALSSVTSVAGRAGNVVLVGGDITDLAAAVRAQVEAMLLQGTNVTLTLGGSGASRTLTISAIGGGGTLSLARWSALEAQPPNSGYATFDTRNSIAVLDFDAAASEATVFVGIIPEGANLSSGLRVRIVWTATSATTGDVVWESAIDRGNTDIDTDSWGTAKTATTTKSGTSGGPAVTVIDHTSAEIDGVGVGELFRLRVRRIGTDGADTMAGDAEIIAVELRQI